MGRTIFDMRLGRLLALSVAGVMLAVPLADNTVIATHGDTTKDALTSVSTGADTDFAGDAYVNE